MIGSFLQIPKCHMATSGKKSTEPSDLPPTAKRRANHNEIEKKRRDQQRQQIELLRENIPHLRNVRTSTLAIVTEAINFIKGLQGRVYDLETTLINAGIPVPPSQLGNQQFISLPAEPHTMPETDLYGFLFAKNTSLTPPNTSLLNSPKMNNEAGSLLTTNAFTPILPKKGSIARRDSALLLPTKDPNTFVFGKRDSSIQNFFSGTIPSIFEDNILDDIKCTKCHRGVDSLVMIDCDQCHSWYHVRCVGIDPVFIPLHWSCPECYRHH